MKKVMDNIVRLTGYTTYHYIYLAFMKKIRRKVMVYIVCFRMEDPGGRWKIS